MKPGEGMLTAEAFKGPKLHPQNTIDGTKLLDQPDIKTLENSLFIVTPCMGTLMLSYVKSLLELQSLCLSPDINIIPQFHMVRSSIIITGRNMCVQAFLKSRCSHMLFIDSDIEFDAPSILMMMKADKDIVLTPYPMKAVNWDKARDWNTLPDADKWTANAKDHADTQGTLMNWAQKPVTYPTLGQQQAIRNITSVSTEGQGLPWQKTTTTLPVKTRVFEPTTHRKDARKAFTGMYGNRRR